MRLIEIGDDGELTLIEYFGVAIPPYAILSHTWGQPEDEVSFKDIQKGRHTTKSSYVKLRFCADQAKKYNVKHFWVDTCCIDKSSSAELSEAINSIYRWYKEANAGCSCLTYQRNSVTDRHGMLWIIDCIHWDAIAPQTRVVD